MAAPPPSSLLHLTPRIKPASPATGLILPGQPAACPGHSGSDIPPISESEARFRHSGWAAKRAKVWQALQSTGQRSTRLLAFANCGHSAAVMLRTDSDQPEYRLVSSCCHDRLCDPCAACRAGVIARNLAQAVEGRTVRFLTLTLKVNSLSLADQIDRLYQSFTRLRHRKLWKSAVKGGAAFLEIQVGENSGAWHVHLHVLVETSWLDQRALSHEWYAATGDSYIVDIRPLDTKGERISYVAKYGSKAISARVVESPDKLQEAVLALRGRRLCLTFGSWRGIKLEAAVEEEGAWVRLCSLADLLARAESGERLAQGILGLLLRGRNESQPTTYRESG